MIRDPRFFVSVILTDNENEEVLNYTGETPKEIMDRFKALIGDGNATVTVGTDMGLKNYGRGVSVMVSVSLACNQDEQTINAAVELAASAGRYYAHKFQSEGESELRAKLEAQGRKADF